MENEDFEGQIINIITLLDTNDDVIEKYAKELVKKIRQDTLRQILPEKLGESTTSYGFGCDDMIKRIINKAKEIWGIDLSKD